MSKFGVGVGEEFPIDEGKPAENGPGGSRQGEAGPPETDAERCARHRAWREARWARRAEWRARKPAFRNDMRRSMHEHFGDHPFTEHNGTVLRVLIGVALAALAIALLPMAFLVAALLLVVIFFAAHRGGFRHYHRYHRHDVDA